MKIDTSCLDLKFVVSLIHLFCSMNVALHPCRQFFGLVRFIEESFWIIAEINKVYWHSRKYPFTGCFSPKQ